MKKFKLYLFTLLSIMIVGITNVNAEVVSSWSELKTCLETESEGKMTCETTEAIVDTGDRIKVAGEKSLVLGGKLTVNTYIWVTSGSTLTVDGDIEGTQRILFYVYPGGTLNINSGNITSVYEPTKAGDIGNLLAIYGSETEDGEEVVVNVAKGVTMSEGGIFVYPNTSGNDSAYNVTVNFAGTIAMEKNVGEQVFSVHGYITKGMPVITIKEGASITNVDAPGIYGAGNAHWIIEDGKITGETGVEIRAGKLEVKGGIITGTGDPLSTESNSSGSTTVGAGIAVAQHTTKLAIDAQISGGTITGKEAVKVSFPEEGAVEDIVKVSITGGTYSTDVKEYIATGLVSKKVGDTYTVGKEYKILEGMKVTNGTVASNPTSAVVGETVTLTLTPNEGYELSKLEVKDANGNVVEVKDNAFVMPNAAVTVTAVYTKVITEIPVISETTEVEEVVVGVKEADKVEDVLLDSLKENEELAEIAGDSSVKIVVEIDSVKEADLDKKVVDKIKEEAGKTTIAEFFDINILVKDVLTNTNLGNITELTEEIELMILLPEELKNSEEGTTRKYYVVRHHVVGEKEEVELIDAKVSEDGKYLVFKTDKFSTYALAYEDVAATPNTPQTGDSIGLYIILGFISIAAIGLSLNNLKKRNSINV